MCVMCDNLSKCEINHIKTSMNRCSIQGLADELGRDKETIERKVNEVVEKDRVSKLCNYFNYLKSNNNDNVNFLKKLFFKLKNIK